MIPVFMITAILTIILMVPIGFLFPFIGIATAAAGLLAKAGKALFSGEARANRQARRAQKSDIKSNLGGETGGVLGLFGKRKERKAEEAAEEKKEEAKKAGAGIMEIVKKYWWIGAIVAGIFFLPKLLGGNPGTRRRRSSNSGSSFSARMQAAKRRKARTRK